MTNNASLGKSKNKSFIINNSAALKHYAQKNYKLRGEGIVVINLLLLDVDDVEQLNIAENGLLGDAEITVQQPISYIPKRNFWFKTISLKIKKKYQIDLQTAGIFDNKFLVVFIKDASIENFSIYSIKI